MAGDWLKWTKGLTRKREVVAIAAQLKISRREVAATLMEVWEWADENTVDCHVPSVTKSFLDELSGVTGFADAMQREQWLVETADGIMFPNFDRHNGQTAKERALASNRKQKQRGNVTETSRSKRDKSVTREEKRREEKSSSGDICSWFERTIERSTVKDWCSDRFGKVAQKRKQKPLADDARTRDMLLRVGVLAIAGAVSEAFINDAVEGLLTVEKYPANPGGWLRQKWRDSLHLPAGSDFDEMLRQVQLPKGI